MFICRQIFKIFVAIFKTFGKQKDDKITFCWRCFGTSWCAEKKFRKDGVRRVVLVTMATEI